MRKSNFISRFAKIDVPKITVVIPCYNAGLFLDASIRSLTAQSVADWECVIFNDGSTDDTRKIAETWCRKDSRFLLVNQENLGVSCARNVGFRAGSAAASYVLFLDSDDCLHPDMLKKLGECLDSNPKVGLARCEYEFMDHKGSPVSGIRQKERYVPTSYWVRQLSRAEKEIPFVSVFALSGIVPSVALIRRSVFAQTSGFDETFGQHHEDTDLFLKLRLLADFYYFPETLVTKRIHARSSTAHNATFQQRAALKEKLLVAKWSSHAGLSQEQMILVSNALLFKQYRLEACLGFARSYGYVRKGSLLKALQFFIGALRRYLPSLFHKYNVEYF